MALLYRRCEEKVLRCKSCVEIRLPFSIPREGEKLTRKPHGLIRKPRESRNDFLHRFEE
jgi:hypothetical protein